MSMMPNYFSGVPVRNIMIKAIMLSLNRRFVVV